MKKILFVIGQLRVGGVAKALVELLKSIDGMYDVSLLCFDQKGSFFEEVPKSVHILPTSGMLELSENSASAMKSRGTKYYLVRNVLSVLTKGGCKPLAAKLWTRMAGKVPGEYDLAISYTHPMPKNMFCNMGGELVLDRVNAKKKAVFVHCDYASYGGDCSYNRKLLRQFDAVAGVSRSVGERVASVIPELREKICVVRNCHAYEDIRRMAESAPVSYSHDMTFVSVARLSEEKGFFRCMDTFAKLHQEGYDVGWHIVGGGPLQKALEEKIKELSAEDYVILEGEQVNSPRYMKNADWLLVSSFHEAAPMVFDEALTVKTAVLSTRTLSADEMVTEREIGVVCDNTDEALRNAIEEIVRSGRHGIEDESVFVASNEEAIQGFKNLCEDT